jgi:Inositol phosphatase
MVNDFFSQTVIDLLIGNVTSQVFEDFESDMMSNDPGISLLGVRDSAIETCTRIVIQDEDEDLIHGWTLLSPSQPNTLRTLPFEEAVVLLTDAAVYCCKFDWNTQKVSSFEKIDLRSITKMQYGTYITSTLSERQMAEALNVGIAIQYSPDKNSVMRVNTRSLQNVVSNEQVPQGVDGGTGLMSWVASHASGNSGNNSRTMALKCIPSETDLSKSNDVPLAVAERICDDIRRAVTGSTDHGEQVGVEMVEKGDIISLAEAKKRTGYLEHLGHSIKKLVWT